MNSQAGLQPVYEQQRPLFCLSGTSRLCRSHTWVAEVKSWLNISLGMELLESDSWFQLFFREKNITLKNHSCKTRSVIQTSVGEKFLCQRHIASPGIFPQERCLSLSHENSDTGPGEPTDKTHLPDIINYHSKFKSINFYRKKKKRGIFLAWSISWWCQGTINQPWWPSPGSSGAPTLCSWVQEL